MMNYRQKKSFRSCFIWIFCIFIASNLQAQKTYINNDSIRARKDLIDLIVKLTKRSSKTESDTSTKKVFFSLLPAGSGTSGNRMSISSINAAFYLGKPENTNLSNVSFYPATNFASYFQFKIFPNLWLSKNEWNVPGKLEFSRIKQDTYGLGANTSTDSLNVIDYNLASSNLTINREVLPYFFLGLGLNLDYFYNVGELWDKNYSSEFQSYKIGTGPNTVSSGITLNFLYDDRKNSINPLQGLYSHLFLRINSPAFGSTYKWSSLYFDTRKYISFSNIRHKTLALWGMYWATWGDVPYLNLPGNALDYSGWTGRGYYRARYRGSQMIYGEAEYRFDLTKSGLLGGVVFVNAESFTEPVSKRFEYILPAAGLGCRIKFNKYSDSNMTADIAFGKHSFNWYISLNEAF